MKHTKEPTEANEFQLVRAFSAAHNARRLMRHCERLRRQPDMQRWLRGIRLHRRFGTAVQRRQACSAA